MRATLTDDGLSGFGASFALKKLAKGFTTDNIEPILAKSSVLAPEALANRSRRVQPTRSSKCLAQLERRLPKNHALARRRQSQPLQARLVGRRATHRRRP